jgi:hypothetical protein
VVFTCTGSLLSACIHFAITFATLQLLLQLPLQVFLSL